MSSIFGRSSPLWWGRHGGVPERGSVSQRFLTSWLTKEPIVQAREGGDAIVNGPPPVTSLPQPQALKTAKPFKQHCKLGANHSKSEHRRDIQIQTITHSFIISFNPEESWTPAAPTENFPWRFQNMSQEGHFLSSIVLTERVDPRTTWFLLLEQKTSIIRVYVVDI